MAPRTTLVWFRQDLRLRDNPALAAAARRGGSVIPVYVWAPEEERPWEPGRAARWWLARSLEALNASLRERGSRLVVRRGPTRRTLLRLAEETGADAVFWNRRYEPAIAARDESLKALPGTEAFSSALLFEPGGVLNGAGRPFRVFSAFWRACQRAGEPENPSPIPARIPVPSRWPASDTKVESSMPIAGWEPGEAGAQAQLRRFLRRGAGKYEKDRDRPDIEGTSRLSPHLHFGEIGPRQVWHALRPHRAFLRELAWREFAYHLLVHFPHTTSEPLYPQREAAAPREIDRRVLRLWQTGRTGYPIVDAGMRQLLQTGWMHNRVRMLVASFLVKDLLIPWQEGAAWFWDRLVDADLANNTLNWQWVAGCGADAVPWFRVFNPATQARKFDPAGDYVRRWVPEVAGGGAYPPPIVDHAAAVIRARGVERRAGRRP